MDARKRQQKRAKQQRYRARIHQEFASLRENVSVLQEHIDRLVATASIIRSATWQDVAIGLRDERDDCEETNRTLKLELEKNQDIIQSMASWIYNMTPSEWTSWHNFKLFAHPSTRQLGMEWMSKHLYAQTDRMLEKYLQPSFDLTDDFKIEFMDYSSFKMRSCFQKQVNMPLEQVCAVLRPNIWKFYLRAHLTSSEVYRLMHTIVVRHTLEHPQEYINVLSCEIQEPNRHVFVGQQVHGDELFPEGSKWQRDRKVWVSVHRISSTQCQIRSVFSCSQAFTSNGYIPLVEEASLWGLDIRGQHPLQASIAFESYIIDLGRQFAQQGRTAFERSFSL